MKTHLIQTIKIVILALVLTLGVSYVFAWTGPTATPPADNTPTPVNIGTTNQIKDGGLSVDALSVFGTTFIQNLLGIGDSSPSNKIEINTDGVSSGIDFDGRTTISGYSGNGWLRLNNDSEFSSGVYTPGIFRADGGIQVDDNTVIGDGAGWHYTYGDTGWYNQTHGGGIYMQDTTWIRASGNKWFYTGGVMRADTDMRSAKYCDINGANCKTTAQMGGTDTNANTICSGTYTYLNGDGACRSVKTDGGVTVKGTDPKPSNWPDAIICTISGQTHKNYFSGLIGGNYYYSIGHACNAGYNSAGNWVSDTIGCDCPSSVF